ncbi:sel1 repeat family protein [Shewanella canadensis]|uniref:Sel1 repeat family protein n=1 Tax=Shewanella canadensis TaxID=271096 RepID=A0A3S0K9N6_9GAMM|nr:sel1 repeat family protein [Shewanella canadensis]RTR38654.1 sel1 repeat family protein [Shewanella canadensis]
MRLITLIITLVLSSSVNAESFIREIYFKHDSNAPEEPKIVANELLKRDLALELWSQRKQIHRLEDRHSQTSMLTITNKELSSKIQFSSVLDWRDFGDSYYMKAKLHVIPSELFNTIEGNQAHVVVRKMSAHYTGSTTDSKANIFNRAVEQLKADALFSLDTLVNIDSQLLQKADLEYFDSIITRTTSTNISIQHISDVSWTGNTVSVTADIAIYEKGLLAESENIRNELQSRVEVYQYFDRPIIPYVLRPSSNDYKAGVKAYKKYSRIASDVSNGEMARNFLKKPGKHTSQQLKYAKAILKEQKSMVEAPTIKNAQSYLSTAIKHWDVDAKNGDVDAMWLLCFAHSWDVNYLSRDLQWCREAAQNGHALSQITLGYHYAIGNGLEHNTPASAFWLKLGIPEVMQQINEQLPMTPEQIFGYDKSRPYKEVPSDILNQLSAIMSKSLMQLGQAYRYGFGIEVDEAKAEDMFTTCIEEFDNRAFTHGYCHYELGLLLEEQATRLEKGSDAYAKEMLSASYKFAIALKGGNSEASNKVAESLITGFLPYDFYFKKFAEVNDWDSTNAAQNGYISAKQYAAAFIVNKLRIKFSDHWSIADVYVKYAFPFDYTLSSGEVKRLKKMALATKNAIFVGEQDRSNDVRGYASWRYGLYLFRQDRAVEAIPFLEQAAMHGDKLLLDSTLLLSYMTKFKKLESFRLNWQIGSIGKDEGNELLRKMMYLSRRMLDSGNSQYIEIARQFRRIILPVLENEPFYQTIKKKQGLPVFSKGKV